MPNSGSHSADFAARDVGTSSITFASGDTTVGYARDREHLTQTVGSTTRGFTRTTSPRAPEIEAADVAFANDTAARGVDGWVAAFDAHGAMMRKTGRIEGADAIRAAMAPVLATTKVAWAPTASGKRGDLGFTIGKATFIGRESFRSTYVTIWKQQADGSWKVLFDTGRAVQE